MALCGEISPTYKFGENMIYKSGNLINHKHINVLDYSQAGSLSIPSPYGDMIE